MNKKRIIIITISLVFIFIAVVSVVMMNKERSIVKEVNPNLTEEEWKIVNNRIQQARVALEREGLSNDEKAQAYYFLGSALFGSGKYQDAKNALNEALKLDKENRSYLAQRFTVESAMKDFGAARNTVRYLTQLQPNNPGYWRWLIDLEREQFGASVDSQDALYKEALVKTGENPDILSVYAQFLEKKGDFQGALLYWKKAADKDPQNTLYVQELQRLESKISLPN